MLFHRLRNVAAARKTRMATTRKLIDAWVEAGLPHEQATKVALALDDYLESRLADASGLDPRLAELDKSFGVRVSGLEHTLVAGVAGLERGLAKLQTRLLVCVIGLAAIQLGALWALARM